MDTIVGAIETGEKIVVDATTGEYIRLTSFEQRATEIAEEKKRMEDELKREKKNGYNDFYMVNRKHSDCLEKIIKENHTAALLLQFLLNNMDGYNAVVCSYAVVQDALGISTSTILRSVNYLRNGGYITVGKSGTTNVYIVNPELAWSSWGSNKKYCKFPANVILAESENPKLIKAEKEKHIHKKSKKV